MQADTVTVEQVPARDWQDWAERTGGTIVDVREPMEWAMGSLAGAVHLPMSGMPANLDALDPTAPLLLICRTGSRSQMVARYLAANGFDQVANLTGGLFALGLA